MLIDFVFDPDLTRTHSVSFSSKTSPRVKVQLTNEIYKIERNHKTRRRFTVPTTYHALAATSGERRAAGAARHEPGSHPAPDAEPQGHPHHP